MDILPSSILDAHRAVRTTSGSRIKATQNVNFYWKAEWLDIFGCPKKVLGQTTERRPSRVSDPSSSVNLQWWDKSIHSMNLSLPPSQAPSPYRSWLVRSNGHDVGWWVVEWCRERGCGFSARDKKASSWPWLDEPVEGDLISRLFWAQMLWLFEGRTSLTSALLTCGQRRMLMSHLDRISRYIETRAKSFIIRLSGNGPFSDYDCRSRLWVRTIAEAACSNIVAFEGAW